MSVFSQLIIGFVGLLHVYILILEMFLWTTPKGQKAFNLTAEFSAQSAVLAANQGLYNGFLALGLFWSLLHPNPSFAIQLAVFFLSCVFVAGVYGALTSSKKILYIQTLPAAFGLLSLLY